MSRYGHYSDYRAGERDFERNGSYGYDERRYRYDRDYQDGFNEARRADERRRERREQEEDDERRREYAREQQRFLDAEEEEAAAEYEAQRQEVEPAESEANDEDANHDQ